MIPEYLDVSIFPLPNVTLFPKTLLPLHIFEPRYREMIGSSLNGDRLLGVALLREGWQKDYFANPPIHKTFGIGKIIDYEQYDNGCYDIVVEGLYRARLVTEHATDPFRTGRVSILQDAPIDHIQSKIAAIRKEIRDAASDLVEVLPEYEETFQGIWAAHPHPAVTADLIASSLVVDSYDRQSILEEPEVDRRLKLVLVQMRRILFQLAQKEVEEEVFEED